MLKPVNLIAKDGTSAYYAHVFKSMIDDSDLVVEISMDEYKALGLQGAKAPDAPQGFKYGFSLSAYRYDTPSARLEDDCYSDEGEAIRVFSEGSEVFIKKSVLAALNEALAKT